MGSRKSCEAEETEQRTWMKTMKHMVWKTQQNVKVEDPTERQQCYKCAD